MFGRMVTFISGVGFTIALEAHDWAAALLFTICAIPLIVWDIAND